MITPPPRTTRRSRRWWPGPTAGFVVGGVITAQLGHVNAAMALTLKANTQAQRVGVVILGVLALVALMTVSRRIFGTSFAHGFTVASGLFLSVDIVAFHWIFQLHRITSGPEATWLEPILAALGAGMAWLGVMRERGMVHRTGA